MRINTSRHLIGVSTFICRSNIRYRVDARLAGIAANDLLTEAGVGPGEAHASGFGMVPKTETVGLLAKAASS